MCAHKYSGFSLRMPDASLRAPVVSPLLVSKFRCAVFGVHAMQRATTHRADQFKLIVVVKEDSKSNPLTPTACEIAFFHVLNISRPDYIHYNTHPSDTQ